MLVETNQAEILDRYLILHIKYDKTGCEEILKQKKYLDQFLHLVKFTPNAARLHEIHLKLWAAEDSIRMAIKDGDEGMAFEFAKDICRLNDERSAIKRLLGSPETKHYKGERK